MADYSFTLTRTATSAEATMALGAALGKILETGDAVLLYGDLGAGKTTFSRGLIQAIAADHTDIVSPTFTLVQIYDVQQGTLYHYDLYRLETGNAATLTELGWDDALDSGITLVEWPQRLVAEIVPPKALHVHITACGDHSRDVTFRAGDWWATRLQALKG